MHGMNQAQRLKEMKASHEGFPAAIMAVSLPMTEVGWPLTSEPLVQREAWDGERLRRIILGLIKGPSTRVDYSCDGGADEVVDMLEYDVQLGGHGMSSPRSASTPDYFGKGSVNSPKCQLHLRKIEPRILHHSSASSPENIHCGIRTDSWHASIGPLLPLLLKFSLFTGRRTDESLIREHPSSLAGTSDPRDGICKEHTL